MIWYLGFDGVALAADLAAGRLTGVPPSSSQQGSTPPTPRLAAHTSASSIGSRAELEVWEGTTHPLHLQQPSRVADATLALLERVT
jgi:hypothetical protein